MKKSGKSILYLSIVILIIVVIILILIINLLNTDKIENNEKLKKEQLGETTTNNTYVLMQTHSSELHEQEQKLVLFKSAIANAITEMGVETSTNADANTMVSNIRNLFEASNKFSKVVKLWSGKTNTTYTFESDYDTILVLHILGGNYNPTNTITNNTSVYNLSTSMVAIDIFNNVKKSDILTLTGNNGYGSNCEILSLQ